MRRFEVVMFLVCAICFAFTARPGVAAVGDIITVAGGALRDGGPAKVANVLYPAGVAVDGAGSLYIADTGNNRIRKILGDGTITTVAGSGNGGFFGDGGPATSAGLRMPTGVAIDSDGNLYIADQGNNRIRKISAAGTISTLAGTGAAGFSGDGGVATSAALNQPYGIVFDAKTGAVYFSDQGNQRIRMIAADGTITTVAGIGTTGGSGDGGPATSARLFNPAGLAVDGSGTLYIADQGNNRIRVIAAPVVGGSIAAFAGTGSIGDSGDNGPATAATLSGPSGVAVFGSDVYIADRINQVIRKVSNGTISRVAGNGLGGYSDGVSATTGFLKHPTGIAVDGAGNFYVTNSGSDCVQKITVSSGTLSTLAGAPSGDYGGDGGPATEASLSFGWSVALKDGDIYIADRNNNRIRKVSAATGTITTIAGNGMGPPPLGDGGPAASARVGNPKGVAIDGVTGDLYIADTSTNRIRVISAKTGIITTVAGNGTAGYTGDGGDATLATLNTPSALALDDAGNIYVADEGNNVVRKISGGVITTVAGNGTAGFSGDGGDATLASLNVPCGVEVDSSGNLYIADMANDRIRMVSPAGEITTVAGNGTRGFGGDGGAATSAALYFPAGVAVDGADNLYIADQYNYRIRKVENGTISTVAGNGMWDYAGDNGPATAASIAYPTALAVDANGNIFIADRGNKTIRMVVKSVGPSAPGPPTGISVAAGNAQATVTFSAPASDGGSPITGYTVTSNPAGGVDGNAGSMLLSHVVTGLANGTSYTFTVTASNAIGTGTPSARSNAVTPATVPGAPVMGNATAGNGEATVAFSPPVSDGGSAITGYSVVSVPPGGVDSNAGSTSRIHLVTALKNGTSYTFTVTATNAAGTGAPSDASNAVTPATVPDAPGIASATPGNAEVTVKITPPAGDGGSAITGYTVTSDPAGGVDSNAGSISLTHIVTGLTNLTPYTFTVTATNVMGTGNPSSPSNSVIPAPLPDPPVNVAATAVIGGAVVTFSPPASSGTSAINGYGVISNPPGGRDTNAGSTLLTHTIAGLASGTSYTFTVVARNHVGVSAQSAPSNRIVTPTIPGAPLNVVAKAGIGNAFVTFSPPANNGGSAVNAYGVLTNPPGGHDTNAGSTLLTHSVTGLKSGTYYTFTVVARNQIGIGPQSAPSNRVLTPSVPTPPVKVAAKGGNARATVTFSPPASNGGLPITAYGVLTTPAGGFDTNAGSTLLTHTVTGLKNGVAYTFEVVAKNGVGLSAPSLPSNSVTPATVPGPPVNVVAKAGNARATVAFAAPASNGGLPITGYTVISYPAGGIDINAGSTLLSHTVTGLANGVGYTFRVVATNAMGAGTPSAYANRIVPLATLANRGTGAPAAETGLVQRIRSWITALEETVAAQLSWQWSAERRERHPEAWSCAQCHSSPAPAT